MRRQRASSLFRREAYYVTSDAEVTCVRGTRDSFRDTRGSSAWFRDRTPTRTPLESGFSPWAMIDSGAMSVFRDTLIRLAFVFFFVIAPAALGLEARSVGMVVDGVLLKTGKPVSFSSMDTRNGLVLVFLSPKCPCSQSHEPYLTTIANDYSSMGFQFLGIHSNADELLTDVQAHFESAQLPFPILSDLKASLADRLGALSTPHAFIVSPEGEVIYRGGVTDSSRFSEATSFYLASAIEEVSKGKRPTRSQTRALGCVIRRP